ncbi:MAG TPA: DUF3016 domain-containing protein [Pseudorhodoferax sp.]|nr:DUF3016 domain-containing protein [Pseudorhodoferax sp.]
MLRPLRPNGSAPIAHTAHTAHRASPLPAARHLRWLALALACALAACAIPPAGGPGGARARADVAAGTVSVTYGDPAGFSDAQDGAHETDAARRAWLDALSEHLADRAAEILPPGQRLAVQITDVQRAGRYEGWRGPQAAQLRVVRDIYPPRIDLNFQRLGADGQVLQAGTRQLRDLNFLMRPARYTDDPLRYEKTLVDDWVAKEFGAAR